MRSFIYWCVFDLSLTLLPGDCCKSAVTAVGRADSDKLMQLSVPDTFESSETTWLWHNQKACCSCLSYNCHLSHHMAALKKNKTKKLVFCKLLNVNKQVYFLSKCFLLNVCECSKQCWGSGDRSSPLNCPQTASALWTSQWSLLFQEYKCEPWQLLAKYKPDF